MNREMWNDCVGLVLCLAGLVGVYLKVDCSGWLLFFGFLFFCATSDEWKGK
jgi:hypothetical protein